MSARQSQPERRERNRAEAYGGSSSNGRTGEADAGTASAAEASIRPDVKSTAKEPSNENRITLPLVKISVIARIKRAIQLAMPKLFWVTRLFRVKRLRLHFFAAIGAGLAVAWDTL